MENQLILPHPEEYKYLPSFLANRLTAAVAELSAGASCL